MLERLKIYNIALIKELEIDFNNGLNVLFGETGAGKSIIIDSLNFLLGDRADKSLIRNNESFAKVEGQFFIKDNYQIQTMLQNYGISFDDVLIISRLMSRDNKSDIRINGTLVTLSILKEITSILVDICSQNENLFLLKNKNQLSVLDSFCSNEKNLKKYNDELNKYYDILNKLKLYGGSEEDRNKEIDFLEFQINEIIDANLTDNEDESISNELKKMVNLEKITNSLKVINEYFENHQGIMASISSVIKEIGSITQYDKSFELLAQRINSSRYDLDDIYYELKNSLNNLDYDPERYYILDSRMDLIKRLQKKYGKTVKDILNYKEILQNRLDNLNTSKDEINKLEEIKEKILDNLYIIGLEISNKRKEYANKLENNVVNELKNLNMLKTQFKIKFNDFIPREHIEKNLHKNGLDEIEFLFSANIGQPLQPLNKIISGGEMSRFMLAIKSVLAESDNIPVLIFDEIDTGISGKTSIELAKKMVKISKSHQILVVTHSFQVVAMADRNIYVSKIQKDNETITNITLLNEMQVIKKLAEMLGSDEITETSQKQALELRNWCNKYKNVL